MALVINCECGYVVRGESEDELLVAAREHIGTNHPAVAAAATDADYIAMAQVEPRDERPADEA